MVVVCEKCDTRFHLDDSRVPAKGARVRCSRCKHAFFVKPPGRAEAEAIDEVVAEVTGSGGMPVPEPTQDLPHPKRRGAELEPRPASAPLRGEDRSSTDFEEDWEFNDDSPSEIPGRAAFESPETSPFGSAGLDSPELSEPEIGVDAADLIGEPEPEMAPPVRRPALDPVESIRARDAGLDSLAADELGSPADWDFVGGADAAPASAPTPEPTLETAAPFADGESSASPSTVVEEPPTASREAPVELDQLPWPARLTGLASIGGWLLVALAFSVGMSSVFTQPGESGAMSARPAEIAVSGLDVTATEVRGRLLENALAGNILVVSGDLENRGSNALTPRRTVWVQLVSADGEPIPGARAVAGRALTERRLREQDPDRLRQDLERSALERAHQPLRPGERVRFDAVFESIPETATGWVLEAVSAPSYPDPGNSLPSEALPAWE